MSPQGTRRPDKMTRPFVSRWSRVTIESTSASAFPRHAVPATTSSSRSTRCGPRHSAATRWGSNRRVEQTGHGLAAIAPPGDHMAAARRAPGRDGARRSRGRERPRGGSIEVHDRAKARTRPSPSLRRGRGDGRAAAATPAAPARGSTKREDKDSLTVGSRTAVRRLGYRGEDRNSPEFLIFPRSGAS